MESLALGRTHIHCCLRFTDRLSLLLLHLEVFKLSRFPLIRVLQPVMALELAKPALTGSTMEQTYSAKLEVKLKFALEVAFAADLVSTAPSLIV